MSDRFEDDRGVIQDLFGGDPVNVTYIKTLPGLSAATTSTVRRRNGLSWSMGRC